MFVDYAQSTQNSLLMSGGGYIIPVINFDFPNSFPSGVAASGVPPLTRGDGDAECPFSICGVRTSTDIFAIEGT